MREAAWIVGCWLLAHVVLIAGAVAWVALYSLVIAPGLPEEAYHAHAQVASPYVSIVLGGPVFWALARWLRSRGLPRRSAWVVWTVYTLVDLAVVVGVGPLTALLLAQWTTSQTLKAVGVAIGTRG